MRLPLKYRNKPVVIDGRRFDSKAEARRYAELRLMERAGLIRDLQCQPQYPIVINGQRVAAYNGDFSYWEKTTDGGRTVCEDVKSAPTKTPLWRLKWKLVALLYPVVIFREVA